MSTVSGTTFFGGKVPPPPSPIQAASVAPLHESIWQSIASAASAGADQINQGVTDIQKGAPGKNPIVGGLEAGLKVGSGIASVISSPAAPVMKPIGQAIQAVGDKIGDIPAVQKFANSKAGEVTSRVAEDLSNAGNIAGTILTAGQLAKIPQRIQDMNASVDKQISSQPKIDEVAKTQAKVDRIAQEWQRPAETPGNTFKNAKAVLNKDSTIPEFLVRQKIDPEMHIEDGKYTTIDTAEALRETAGKISSDGLRPALHNADYSTPKTPISEINVPEELIQAQGKGVTPDDVEAITTKVRSKLEALQRKYPDGMSLEQMHDERITFAQNGKFSPVKDPSVDNAAIANRAISSKLSDLVEKKAPADVPVADFQSYLSKYYKAADYLEALNGKKASLTFVQNLRGTALKYAGAGLGQSLGGGVVSAFAGYSIGKALEHALENMSNPVRTTFLNNLQHTNPEAFLKVQQYLSGGTDTLKLPSPSFTPLGADSAPVTPPEVAPFAEKGGYPLPRDPKTGQIKVQYLSSKK